MGLDFLFITFLLQECWWEYWSRVFTTGCSSWRQSHACSPATDGSVLTVVVRVHRCLWLSLCSSSDIVGVRFFITRMFPLELNCWIYRMCVPILVTFHPAWAKSRKNSWVVSGVESLLHGSWSWLSNCDAMTNVVLLQTDYKVLHIKHTWVVGDSQRVGLLVEIVNTGHLVGSDRRPQSRILRCLYLLKARVTCVGALDWCCITCDRFPQMRCRSAVKSPYHVPRMIPPVPSAYYFSCRSYLTHSCSACGRIMMDP